MCPGPHRGVRRNGGHGAVNAERESAHTLADATFSEKFQAVFCPSRWTGFFRSADPAKSPADNTWASGSSDLLQPATCTHPPRAAFWAEPTSECPRGCTLGRPLLARVLPASERWLLAAAVPSANAPNRPIADLQAIPARKSACQGQQSFAVSVYGHLTLVVPVHRRAGATALLA
jgi:hypothetical protein